ncbi:pentapeptide repeat-containing protein, partial [Nostoc sp. UIC 10890]
MIFNFSGQNLQCQDFSGQNLTGADFSNSDIRGANFTNAILTNTNFQNAKGGLPRNRLLGIVSLILLITLILGLVAGFAPVFTGYLLFPYSISPDNYFAAIVVFSIFIVFAVTTVYKDLITAFFAVSVTAVICGLVLGTMTGKIAGIPAGIVAITVTTLIVYTMLVMMAFLVTVVEQVAGIKIAIFSLFLIFISSIIGSIIATIISVIVAEVFTGINKISPIKAQAVKEAAIAASVGSVVVILFVSYICWRVSAGDEKFIWIGKLAIAVSSIGGTSFQQADLTGAEFSYAKLKNVNFSNAKLIRTNFHLANYLCLARVDNTILVNPIVQDLVVTKRGTHKSYIGCKLKGINLDGADLSYADLSEVDMSQSTLECANLEGANLTKTQALATNFYQANLTAACLEAWNIDSTTQLDGVICQYVYLLNNQQERRPSSGEFAAEEFT